MSRGNKHWPGRDTSGLQLVWISFPLWIVDYSAAAVAFHEDRYVRDRKQKTQLRWIPRRSLGSIRYQDGVETTEIRHDHQVKGLQVQFWWLKQQRG